MRSPEFGNKEHKDKLNFAIHFFEGSLVFFKFEDREVLHLTTKGIKINTFVYKHQRDSKTAEWTD